MEFLIVEGQYRNGRMLGHGVPVLINGEQNGVTGGALKLDAGNIEVSIDVQHTASVLINLKNTTAINPMEVVVNIDADFEETLEPQA